MEVLDDVKLVLFEHFVVRVKLLIFLLQTRSFSLSFLPYAAVQLELLVHMLELFFFGVARGL